MMAWGWSHTEAAYENARENLYALDAEDICIIWAEWRAAVPVEDDEAEFKPKKYAKALKKAKLRIEEGLADRGDIVTPIESMADEIWEHASAYATCDNGGFNAWVCPWGCHTVSFDKDDG
jgi:hypothetical protein